MDERESLLESVGQLYLAHRKGHLQATLSGIRQVCQVDEMINLLVPLRNGSLTRSTSLDAAGVLGAGVAAWDGKPMPLLHGYSVCLPPGFELRAGSCHELWRQRVMPRTGRGQAHNNVGIVERGRQGTSRPV